MNRVKIDKAMRRRCHYSRVRLRNCADVLGWANPGQAFLAIFLIIGGDSVSIGDRSRCVRRYSQRGRKRLRGAKGYFAKRPGGMARPGQIPDRIAWVAKRHHIGGLRFLQIEQNRLRVGRRNCVNPCSGAGRRIRGERR